MNASRKAWVGLIAALASLAVAAVTASPAAAVTKLCKANEVLCSAPNTWAQGTVLNANGTNTKFIIETTVEGKALKLEVSCPETEFGGMSEDVKGLPFEISFWNFQNCTGAGKACTISHNSPRGGLMTATGGGDGTFAWTMSFTISCPEAKVFCKVGAAGTLDFKGGAPAQIIAANEVLNTEEHPSTLNCPATAKWVTGQYVTTKTAYLTN
jgi:hypothetical protein